MTATPITNGPSDTKGDCWVLDVAATPASIERLGDARSLADQLRVSTNVLIIGTPPHEPKDLIHRGADRVWVVPMDSPGQNTCVAAAANLLVPRRPRVVLAAGDTFGRECASRLAARCGWGIVSPTLMVRARGTEAVTV